MGGYWKTTETHLEKVYLFFQDSHATISAKPIIKHHIGDVTRFMPTALKIKRDGAKKGPGRQCK